jgi:hypothetical protein
MQFAIRVTILECFFVKHSCGPLGVKLSEKHLGTHNHWQKFVGSFTDFLGFVPLMTKM